MHLHCQAGGKLDWRDDLLAFVPRPGLANVDTIGAAAGAFTLGEALESAAVAAAGARSTARVAGTSRSRYEVRAAWPRLDVVGRQWVDFQNDVTTRDIELAARENFVSVEHLKRYTTLGMAVDQGKTSNVVGLATMAAIRGEDDPRGGNHHLSTALRSDPAAELRRNAAAGECFAPIKRLPLEDVHRDDGAVFREYGGWLRPA